MPENEEPALHNLADHIETTVSDTLRAALLRQFENNLDKAAYELAMTGKVTFMLMGDRLVIGR